MSTEENDVLVASIDELMTSLRSALLALLPVAAAARLNWTDSFTSPWWENLASAAFDAFVGGPIATDVVPEGVKPDLARYDLDVDNYRQLSWIEVSASSVSTQRELAMIRLISAASPFDTIQCVEVNRRTGTAGDCHMVPWEGARFAVAWPTALGQVNRVTSVVAAE